MKYPGGFTENLQRCVRNARRMRGEAPTPLTFQFWQALLADAQAKVAAGARGSVRIRQLARELEQEIEICSGKGRVGDEADRQLRG